MTEINVRGNRNEVILIHADGELEEKYSPAACAVIWIFLTVAPWVVIFLAWRAIR